MLEIKPIINALFRSKAGAMMLLVQIAVTVAIVSNATFIIQDRVAYLNQETGYPEEEVFSFSIMSFAEDTNLLEQAELDEQTLRNIPGVVNAVNASEVPLSGSGSASSFFLVPNPDGERGVRAAYTMGDENIIDTLGVEIVAGRNFTADEVVIQEDGMDTVPSVGIASRAFLDEMFPEGDGIGKTLYFGPYPMQIVGVVDKMKGPWLKDSRADNLVIIPLVRSHTFQKMIVRTEPGLRASVMAQVEDLMLENSNERVVMSLRGMDEAKQEYNAEDILMMRMLITLVVVLVSVTALGIFGLTVFNINKRTKQIGTRRALGARKSDIVRYFLVENALICTLGLFIGGIAAVYLGQTLLQHYEVPALDLTYVIVTMLSVLVISLLSVLMPANKAANISPSIATRSI